MKRFALVLCASASPALAHHEVVMVSSFLPFIGGITAIVAAATLHWRGRGGRK